MENKNTTPVDKKKLKKPSGKSVTGKPLDGIDVNPQLDTGNQRNEDVVVLTDPLNERAALTFAQRQKRARAIRAKEPKLQRAREVAKHRLAPKEKIEARAINAARNIIKKRFASRRGVSYAELSTAEKIEVDKKVANKQKLIKRLAQRLIPRIRKAEFERLQSFKNGAPLKDMSSTANESFEGIYNKLSNKSDNELVSIIESSIDALDRNNDTFGNTLRNMLHAIVPSNPINETLLKKASYTNIPFSTLKEVFERGMYAWDEDSHHNQEQFAFNRVNSYIAKGRAWNLDSDLREERDYHDGINASFENLISILENKSTEIRKKIEIVDRKPQTDGVMRRQGEYKKKVIDEGRAPGKPYVKPMTDSNGNHRGWESSDKWGHKKYWQPFAKKSAMKHAGIQEEEFHEEVQHINENFNMAWTAGIGVTLTAADIGIGIKPAFEHHPDVIKKMEEEVRSADIEGVVVRTADGRTIVRKQKRNKKIIGTGNLTDGKPDDTL